MIQFYPLFFPFIIIVCKCNDEWQFYNLIISLLLKNRKWEDKASASI